MRALETCGATGVIARSGPKANVLCYFPGSLGSLRQANTFQEAGEAGISAQIVEVRINLQVR